MHTYPARKLDREDATATFSSADSRVNIERSSCCSRGPRLRTVTNVGWPGSSLRKRFRLSEINIMFASRIT